MKKIDTNLPDAKLRSCYEVIIGVARDYKSQMNSEQCSELIQAAGVVLRVAGSMNKDEVNE